MILPKLKFKLNKELDIAMGTEFLDVRGGGIDFGETIVKVYSKLNEAKEIKDFDEREKKVRAFVDKFYRERKDELENKLKEFENTWRPMEEKFFKRAVKLFEGHPWPKGEYICYLSIFPCNPRFLENKTFQCYWKHKRGIKAVSAHELLHFMFYDYVETNHPEKVKKLGEERLWEVSEIFNPVILALPQLVEITGVANPYIYPDLKEDYQKIKSVWEKSKDVPEFISKILISQKST